MATPVDLSAVVKKAMDEALRARGHVNVLIAGRTGVGKSTLINSVFQGRFADTGQGRPVTQATREVTKEGIPLTIFDTRGLELADYSATLGELERLVRERSADKDARRHIHVAWICVQEDGRRVEDAEVQLHTMMARHMPVIGVVTKARNDQGFKAEVQRLLPEAKNVVRVRAIEEVFEDGYRLAAMGLEDLVTLTMECVPEGHRQAFAAAQKASMKAKLKASHAVVVGASAAAGAAGATPIPFSDAFLLVPIQVGMIAGISACFGLELSTAFLSTMVTSAAGSTAATFGGRALVTNLLKLFPGVGTAAGAAIAGTTAAALTAAMGEAYIEVLAVLFDESGGEPPPPDVVAAKFADAMTAKRS